MQKVSRRQLAVFTTHQLQAGTDVSKLADRLAAVLKSQGQLSEVDMLLSDVRFELEHVGAHATITASVARALTTGQRDQIIKAVKLALGVSSADLQESIEPDLLGGMRIETASRSWDHSLRRKLTELRKVFTSGSY